MSKWFGVIVVAASLAALGINATLLLRMTKAEQAIREVQHLQIKVSPEFVQKAENDFKKQLDDTTQKYNKRLEITFAKLEQENKIKFSELLKKKNDIYTILKLLNEKTDKTSSAIAAVVKDSENKALTYLKAARKHKEQPEIALILYVNALSYSEEKTPVLTELLQWQGKLIEASLEQGDIATAKDRLEKMAEICDTHISSGSVSDMAQIPQLKKLLSKNSELIDRHIAAAVKKQEKVLERFQMQLAGINTYEAAEKLLKDVNSLAVDSSLNNAKDALAAAIVLKQSCLTTEEHPVMIPGVSASTPWKEWLANFAKRLNSSVLKTEDKIEDLGTVAEFLSEAKKMADSDVRQAVQNIEKAAQKLYSAYWQQKVDKALSSPNPSAKVIAALSAEAEDFPAGTQNSNADRMLKLNKFMIQLALKECMVSIKQLKELENALPADTCMQMVGTIQAQCSQLLMRIQAMNLKYRNKHFDSEISTATSLINNLNELQSSYRRSSAAKAIEEEHEKRKTQTAQFVEWAKAQIKEAERAYNYGEEKASEWLQTTSSDEPQSWYKYAWETLVAIHPQDLYSAVPELKREFDGLKNKIENRRKPTDKDLKEVRYKRIADFCRKPTDTDWTKVKYKRIADF